MLQVATFTADITPPVGHPLCAGWYPRADRIADPLSANGLVLAPDDQPPIVLCALDWCELSNREYLRWRQALAMAVGTEADRVAVHCIHAHDTPWPDREAQTILDQSGYGPIIMLPAWAEEVRAATAKAAAASLQNLRPCTHVSTGEAHVDRVASNRRLVGDDGKIWAMRYTKTPDPAIRAEPEGLIDPMLKSVGFWDGETRLACLHYYAVHPTSLDGTGAVTPEFVGLARNRRTAEDPTAHHIYFTGCAGNITAGKYNDGSADNRDLFAQRIYDAMDKAEAGAERQPIDSLRWHVEPIQLPPREDLQEDALRRQLERAERDVVKSRLALQLAYLQRLDVPIPVTALHLNEAVSLLHLPGEAFIEYQLHAYASRPDAFIGVASYGDLGTGYITLARSFDEGGYEPTDAFVSGEAEAILRHAIDRVLQPG